MTEPELIFDVLTNTNGVAVAMYQWSCHEVVSTPIKYEWTIIYI